MPRSIGLAEVALRFAIVPGGEPVGLPAIEDWGLMVKFREILYNIAYKLSLFVAVWLNEVIKVDRAQNSKARKGPR